MNTTVAIVGLSHPHSEMYLETLAALDEVDGVVLVEADEAVRRSVVGRTTKARGDYADLDAALQHPGLTHVLVAVPNDRAPAALVRAIEAGKSVFTEKPGGAVRDRLSQPLGAGHSSGPRAVRRGCHWPADVRRAPHGDDPGRHA
jgi:predicted dehydrogenase